MSVIEKIVFVTWATGMVFTFFGIIFNEILYDRWTHSKFLEILTHIFIGLLILCVCISFGCLIYALAQEW